MRKAIFLIQTSDRKGLLAEISTFFYSHGYNILLCRQYTDVRENKYFMRIIIDLCEQTTRKQLEEDFAQLARKFDLHYSLYYDDVPQNVAIMVSQTSHCLYDLLMHAEEGDLNCRIPLIISNHPDLESVADRFRIPFYCCPMVPDGKAAQEERVLDLLNMEKSHCYNPFVYLRDDNDVQRLVTNLFKSTTPKGSQSNDPFWDTAASMLLLALIFYLKYEAPPDEQNFPMVMEMLRAADVREDCDEYTSSLDELFERLEMREPDHIAVKYYKDYHSGSAKTLKSIQITLAARLEKFNLSSLAALTATDELDLPSLGEKKVALFALIPDNDTSFNFLVSILYTQLFQQLFYLADHKYGGSLPVPVHFLMDEFSNVSLPEDFSKILAVMRSRNVYVSIILQNVAALKALFEKEWESILGNCDEFLYLGGNETSTHKLISESYLGKSTIDTNTYGKSSGRNGNYSTNYQISGRELLTPDEVRMLDNRYALLFIRGERPVMDEKYDILKHPNIALTEDGGAAPYEHGGTENAIATLSFAGAAAETLFELSEPIPDYELLSDEDIEALF